MDFVATTVQEATSMTSRPCGILGSIGTSREEAYPLELLQQFHTGRGINPLGTPAIRLQSAGPTESERPLTMVRSHRKRKRARQVDKIRQQVRHDPTSFFVANLERVFDEWVSILLTTTLPCGISSSDPCILTAFRLLDSTIDGSESMRSRFAHLQLLRVFESLENIIAEERKRGWVEGKRGEGDATVALAIYESAQLAIVKRRASLNRKRAAKFWRALAGPSPFFLLAYAGGTEYIMWVYQSF